MDREKKIPDQFGKDWFICFLLLFSIYPTYGGLYAKHIP